MKQSIYVLVGVVAVLLIAGGYYYPTIDGSLGVSYATSTTGVLNTTAKRATVSLNPTTATTTSIYNGDSTDRMVLASYAGCTRANVTVKSYTVGAGLSSANVKSATTSSSGSVTGLTGNTNYVTNIDIATSSEVAYVASTTEPVLSAYGRVWPTGTYLTFLVNGTSTMSCTFGVDYINI